MQDERSHRNRRYGIDLQAYTVAEARVAASAAEALSVIGRSAVINGELDGDVAIGLLAEAGWIISQDHA